MELIDRLRLYASGNAEVMIGDCDEAADEIELLRNAAKNPVGYLVYHPKEGKDFQWVPLTDADKRHGYKQVPLYSLETGVVSRLLMAERKRGEARMEHVQATVDALGQIIWALPPPPITTRKD